jgi:hypothetical protein
MSDNSDDAIENPTNSSAPLSESIKDAESSSSQVVLEAKPGRTNMFKRFWRACKRHKLRSVAVLGLLISALVVCIPLKYQTMGLIVNHDVTISVVDTETNQPISDAEVQIRNFVIKTNIDGKVTFAKLKPGVVDVRVTKKYYDNYSFKLTIGLKNPGDTTARIKANGRQVNIKAIDVISGTPLSGVLIESSETSTTTDQNGDASIVLPADKSLHTGKISGANYNEQQIEIISQNLKPEDNMFKLVPSGSLYFLSKKSGKIDLVKTNLDGTNRTTIVPGTGNEDDRSTILLASTDWKYLAYIARHDGDKAKLYILDTSTDTVTEVDGAPGVTVTAVGWSGHSFVYSIQRDKKLWESGAGALKSFDAQSKQIVIIEETMASGSSSFDYASERISDVYILENGLFYIKSTDSSYGNPVPKNMGAYKVNADGLSKSTIKEFDQKSSGYMFAVLSEPDEVYVSVNVESQVDYYVYKDGSFTLSKDLKSENFDARSYPTYLVSPDGQKTFWYESRDGKNTLFVGDKYGQNSAEIRTLTELKPYGWFSDKYLLVSKDSSELFIISSSTILESAEQQPFKVSDYHKPNSSFNGYGYGYGGQ